MTDGLTPEERAELAAMGLSVADIAWLEHWITAHPGRNLEDLGRELKAIGQGQAQAGEAVAAAARRGGLDDPQVRIMMDQAIETLATASPDMIEHEMTREEVDPGLGRLSPRAQLLIRDIWHAALRRNVQRQGGGLREE